MNNRYEPPQFHSSIYRCGTGFDSHSFTDTKKNIILGGIQIPFAKGFSAHSDGDVLIHAVIDALLGAAGLDDIGTYFPDNEPAYKNIASNILLTRTMELIQSRNMALSNADTVIIAEKPNLAKYKKLIKENMASLLSIPSDRMGVKAKTAEGLGFIGEGKGIAVFASVLLTEKICAL